MQKNRLVLPVALMLYFLITTGAMPLAAQNSLTYSPDITPSLFQYRIFEWRITNVTAEIVEWGWGTGDFWVATEGSHVTYNIHEIRDNEVHGLFTIGNLTLPANDSRIAAELALSIWPWFPGLISPLNWDEVDQNATNAATGFMEGNLDIQTTVFTKEYIYHQGLFGNQNTTLVYDLRTGILQEAYTEFFFQKDYHLGLQLLPMIMIPTPLTLFLIGSIVVVLIALVSFYYALRRRKG